MEKIYKSKFFEMANITPKYSGVLEGIVQIRPEERHILFPHVHYVKNVKEAESKFVKISLSKKIEDIEIIESKNLNLSKKELDHIKQFLVLNYNLLIKYYNQAEFLDTGDFISNIKKIKE